MKAIVLTDFFGGGGAERVASLLVNGLSNAGHEVHVCLFLDVQNYKIDISNVKFHLLSSKQYPYVINVLNRLKNLIWTIKKERPDVIYSFGPIMASYVIMATKMSGLWKTIKIISSERNDPRYEPVSDLKKKIRDFCYRRSDVIVCQTQMAVELLRQRNIDNKYVIIPNPISPNLPLWHGQESKDIITAARLTEQKNLPLMIRAFKRIYNEYPDFKLIIYGEGELRENLQSLIDSEGLSGCVKMPGFTTDIHVKMASSFMYVSSSDYEGISNSMLEALAIGLPCVCTDCPVGGTAMYIKNNISGLLVKVGDEVGLYKAMKKLIESKDLQTSFSQTSMKIRNELSVNDISKRWVNLISA